MTHTMERRLEFDAAHRVTLHESKCKNLHGHRYQVWIEAEATELDECGRIVDFGVVKEKVGGWIDKSLDHGTIVKESDSALIKVCSDNDWKFYVMYVEPTAENIACEIFNVATTLLNRGDVRVTSVTVWETPNCKATYKP